MWRLIPLLIVGFWASMTFLLAKKVLKPDTEHAQVPIEEVFELFFETVKEAAFTQVVIYHENEKVGLGSITAKMNGDDKSSGNIRSVGHAKIAEDGSAAGVLLAWDGELQLLGLEEMEYFSSKVDIKKENFVAVLKVKEGERPSFRVTKDEKVLADSSKGLFKFLGAGIPIPGSAGSKGATLPKAAGPSGTQPVITATKQVRDLAGRQRGVYVVEVKPSAEVGFSMVFTDMGEFVLLTGLGEYEMRSALFDGVIQEADAEYNKRLEEKLKKQ